MRSDEKQNYLGSTIAGRRAGILIPVISQYLGLHHIQLFSNRLAGASLKTFEARNSTHYQGSTFLQFALSEYFTRIASSSFFCTGLLM